METQQRQGLEKAFTNSNIVEAPAEVVVGDLSQYEMRADDVIEKPKMPTLPHHQEIPQAEGYKRITSAREQAQIDNINQRKAVDELKEKNKERMEKMIDKSIYKPLTEDSPLSERVLHYRATGEKLGDFSAMAVQDMNLSELLIRSNELEFSDEEAQLLRESSPKEYAELIKRGKILSKPSTLYEA